MAATSENGGQAAEYNHAAEVAVKITRASDRPAFWWSVKIDGREHGGGYAKAESIALRDASNYVRDIGR